MRRDLVLGLALGQREITAAEVAADPHGAASLLRAATFPFPQGLDPSSPALAEALKRWLKENSFSASRVVLGLPARSLMARERSVPPSSPDTAAALLRLQAERQFPAEVKDLVYDYAGHPDSSHARNVLLLAAPQPQVSQAADLARAAGLTPLAVTPSALALSSVLASRHEQHVVLSLGDESAELVIRSDSGPRLLRHLAISAPAIASSNGVATPALLSLGSELLRTVAVSASSADVVLWDGIGLKPEALSTLAQRSGLELAATPDLSPLDLAGEPARAKDAPRYASAAALAIAGLKPALLPADFLHSKLAPPKQRRIGRKVVLISLAVLAAAAVIGYPIYDIYSLKSQIQDIKDSLTERLPQTQQAEALATKLRFAAGWYDAKPPVLDCLLHISQAFPPEGSIWVDELTFNETVERNNTPSAAARAKNEPPPVSYKCALSGKATDRRAVLSVRDFLMNDPRFSDVQLGETHEGSGRDRDTSFKLKFTFLEAR